MLIPFFATLQQISPSTTEALTQPSRSSGQNGLPISRDLSPLVARFKLSNPANKVPREKQSNHTLPAISSASVLPTGQIYLFGPRVKTPLLVRTYPGFDNKSSAIDPGPQVDVNWYAYNGETIAERDRATVALQKRPFDPVGRAHGWGKIGVKMVISWLYCCRATDLLDPLLNHGGFVCFPFLSNQLKMIERGTKRMRGDWFKNQRRGDVLRLIWSSLEKETILIMFLLDLSDISRRLDDVFFSLSLFKRVNIAVIFYLRWIVSIIFARTNFRYRSFRWFYDFSSNSSIYLSLFPDRISG